MQALAAIAIFAIHFISVNAAVSSRESSISAAARNALNSLLQDAYFRAQAVLDFTGTISSVPTSKPYIHSYVNLTGDSSQAIYGVINSIPNVRNSYFALQNGGFIGYNPLTQFAFAQDKYTACPAALNSAALNAPCRQAYHYGSAGSVTTTTAVISNGNYDATQRPWYTQAVSRGKLGWTNVFTFASSSPQLPSVPGVTLCGPFYKPGTTTLQGVAAVDIDFTFITPLLQGYAKSDMVMYIVETSTGYLISASSGEVPVVNGAIYKASAAKDPIVSQSATYLTGYTFGNTWAADGDYFTTLNGVGYVCNVVSYTDPQTSTLAWKFVTCGAETALPSTNYITPQADALQYTVNDITAQFTNIQAAAQLMAFLAGSLNNAPNAKNSIETATSPSLTGPTQQSLWLTYNVFKSLGTSLYCVAAGYKSDGTYLSYAFPPEGSSYYSYRGGDPNSGCAAVGSLSGLSSSCLQKYAINADGTPASTPYAQSSFDPRTRPWWTASQSTGSPTWSPLFYSTLTSSTINLLDFSYPIYDQTTRAFVGEVVSAYLVNDLATYLNRYESGYVSYVYDTRSGYLLVNNVGAPVMSGTNFISANASSNAVIRESASYLQTNGLLESVAMTVQFNSTENMIINAKYWKDSTATLLLYVVNVKLTGMTSSATTTTTTTTASTSDDDTVTVAKNASISAAVLVAVVLVLLVVLLIFAVTKSTTTYVVTKDPTAPAAEAGVVLSPMGNKV